MAEPVAQCLWCSESSASCRCSTSIVLLTYIRAVVSPFLLEVTLQLQFVCRVCGFFSLTFNFRKFKKCVSLGFILTVCVDGNVEELAQFLVFHEILFLKKKH